MKKKLGGVFSILLAFVMTLAIVLPINISNVYAAGTEVSYTNDDYSGHNLQVTDNGEAQQVFCIAQGRPWGKSALTHSGMRVKYEWNADPVEYNAISNAGNSLVGGPYTYALSWAIVGGAYTSEGNVRPEMQPGKEGFSPLDDMPRLAQILQNIFYYAKADSHSDSEVQSAIYAVITGGDTDTKPRGWNEDSLEHKAWKGGDIGKDVQLWVYLPHPDAITKGNGKGYNITSMDQAFVRGITKDTPEPTEPKVATKVNPKEINAAKGQTFTDTVTLNNLTVGTEYTITGKLMNKDTQSEVTSAICEPVTFTADAASMEKEMKFTVDASSLAGKSLVVFETLSWTVDGEQKSVEHADFDDADQTLTVKEESGVSVKIKKADMGGKELEGAELVVKGADGTEIDSWTSTTQAHEITVAPGEYTLKEVNAPEGYQKVTTEIEFSVDAEGKVTVKTTSVEPAGAVEVDSNGVLILKDELKKDGGDDSGDKPYLQTEAKNTYISPAKNQSITDEVEYGGLKNGEDYVIVGVLKNKSTGETVSSECKPVKIKDASESGVELMDFLKIDASGFQDGDQIVVFEYLYKGTTPGTPGDGTEVAKHADINDEAQTVTVVDGEISLLKTTDIKNAKVGDVIPYEITVSSTRNVTSVVNLEDYLGDNLEYVSASDGGELIGEDTQTVLWSSLEVPANGSATVTIKAKIKNGSGKSVVNEAYVADDYNIDNPMGNDDDSAVLGVYESSDENKNSKNKDGTGTSKTKGAKTGDATKIALFVVVLILAAALTATMIVRRRRSDR